MTCAAGLWRSWRVAQHVASSLSRAGIGWCFGAKNRSGAQAMRQIWITKFGPPEVLAVREAPDPEPKPDEVRIRVEASGVNFADIVGRVGLYPDLPPIPVVPGYEVSGRIDAAGAEVDLSWIGRDVLATTRFGGYADVICV